MAAVSDRLSRAIGSTARMAPTTMMTTAGPGWFRDSVSAHRCHGLCARGLKRPGCATGQNEGRKSPQAHTMKAGGRESQGGSVVLAALGRVLAHGALPRDPQRRAEAHAAATNGCACFFRPIYWDSSLIGEGIWNYTTNALEHRLAPIVDAGRAPSGIGKLKQMGQLGSRCCEKVECMKRPSPADHCPPRHFLRAAKKRRPLSRAAPLWVTGASASCCLNADGHFALLVRRALPVRGSRADRT